MPYYQNNSFFYFSRCQALVFVPDAAQYIAFYYEYLVLTLSFLRFVNLHINGVILLFDYNRFEQLRSAKGITKKFIAQSLGRSSTICQDWKQQKSQPNPEQLRRVAEILDTTPAYLSGETEDPSPASAADGELEGLLTALREREDMRMLFSLARDASPEDVRQAVKIIEALRRDD